VDTLAGYVTTRIGRVPVRGELVPGPGPFELEILDADPRRVKKLRIYRGAGRQDGASREAHRADAGSAPHAAGAPAAHLPVGSGPSASLSGDASAAKSTRRPET